MFPMAPQASPLQTRFTVEENGFLERFRVLKLVLTYTNAPNKPAPIRKEIMMVEEIRGKICRLGSKPALLRRLGPCVTKEELESLHQKNESVTRIFEKMLLFF